MSIPCVLCPSVEFQVHAQISGDVDQSAGMLDDEAKEKGYALMCVAEPQSDCRIRVIEEVGLTSGSCLPS